MLINFLKQEGSNCITSDYTCGHVRAIQLTQDNLLAQVSVNKTKCFDKLLPPVESIHL